MFAFPFASLEESDPEEDLVEILYKLTRKRNASSMVSLYQQNLRKQLVYSHLKLDIWQE